MSCTFNADSLNRAKVNTIVSRGLSTDGWRPSQATASRCEPNKFSPLKVIAAPQ